MLTIVIPTRNRAPFLVRLLQYYASVGCPFPIIIGDSSDGSYLEITKHAINTIGPRLKITHLIDPAVNRDQSPHGWQRDRFLHNLMQYVHTPYVAFYADDDFAVVGNLGKAVAFLESHHEYSFVCGDAVFFSLKEGVAHGPMEGTSLYCQRSILNDSPSRRLLDLFSHYIVLEYGISRTEQKKYRWNKVFESQVNNLNGELINGGLVAIQGKVHKMDSLFLVRQSHASQTSIIAHDKLDCMDFPQYYKKLHDVFSQTLATLGHAISLEEAQETAKKALWFYIAKTLMVRWNLKYTQNNEVAHHWLWNTFKKSYILYTLLQILRSFLPSGRMSLPALLRRSSPYHKDFMPIYTIVTNGKD